MKKRRRDVVIDFRAAVLKRAASPPWTDTAAAETHQASVGGLQKAGLVHQFGPALSIAITAMANAHRVPPHNLIDELVRYGVLEFCGARARKAPT